MAEKFRNFLAFIVGFVVNNLCFVLSAKKKQMSANPDKGSAGSFFFILLKYNPD